jgi:hypothetical protein
MWLLLDIKGYVLKQILIYKIKRKIKNPYRAWPHQGDEPNLEL